MNICLNLININLAPSIKKLDSKLYFTINFDLFKKKIDLIPYSF